MQYRGSGRSMPARARDLVSNTLNPKLSKNGYLGPFGTEPKPGLKDQDRNGGLGCRVCRETAHRLCILRQGGVECIVLCDELSKLVPF